MISRRYYQPPKQGMRPKMRLRNTFRKDSFEEFVTDTRLVQLCDVQRTGDEFLDVIRLIENQHSDILAWVLDPREGHGQGEEILRDLLIQASVIASQKNSGLDGRSTTALFFKEWPPSRIRTTGFGSAFTARELGMILQERVDLFVIDAQNKFILAIENKAGSRHTKEQLESYRNHLNDVVSANPRLKGYAQIYIALDRNSEEDYREFAPGSNYWLHMGYSWLKSSAQRALLHVSRGNLAAKIVMAYCNRQTDWEDPDNALCSRLCAELHHLYPETIKKLIHTTQGRAEKDWLASKEDNPLLLFGLQNKSAIALLSSTKGMVSVKSEIIHTLKIPADYIDNKRIRLYIFPESCAAFISYSWPIYLTLSYVENSTSTFNLTLCWNSNNASTEDDAEYLRKVLTRLNPKFGKHNNSQIRRVNIGAVLSLSEAIPKIAQTNKEIEDAVMSLDI